MSAFIEEGKILKHTELGWEILVDNSSSGMNVRNAVKCQASVSNMMFLGKKNPLMQFYSSVIDR